MKLKRASEYRATPASERQYVTIIDVLEVDGVGAMIQGNLTTFTQSVMVRTCKRIKEIFRRQLLLQMENEVESGLKYKTIAPSPSVPRGVRVKINLIDVTKSYTLLKYTIQRERANAPTSRTIFRGNGQLIKKIVSMESCSDQNVLACVRAGERISPCVFQQISRCFGWECIKETKRHMPLLERTKESVRVAMAGAAARLGKLEYLEKHVDAPSKRCTQLVVPCASHANQHDVLRWALQKQIKMTLSECKNAVRGGKIANCDESDIIKTIDIIRSGCRRNKTTIAEIYAVALQHGLITVAEALRADAANFNDCGELALQSAMMSGSLETIKYTLTHHGSVFIQKQALRSLLLTCLRRDEDPSIIAYVAANARIQHGTKHELAMHFISSFKTCRVGRAMELMELLGVRLDGDHMVAAARANNHYAMKAMYKRGHVVTWRSMVAAASGLHSRPIKFALSVGCTWDSSVYTAAIQAPSPFGQSEWGRRKHADAKRRFLAWLIKSGCPSN